MIAAPFTNGIEGGGDPRNSIFSSIPKWDKLGQAGPIELGGFSLGAMDNQRRVAPAKVAFTGLYNHFVAFCQGMLGLNDFLPTNLGFPY